MSKNTILVVEDQQALLDIISKKLKNQDFSVLKAKTAETALEKVKDNKVDGIWLDHYLLGKEDGLDLVNNLKNEKSTKKEIPIFVVSNTATSDKVQTYLRLGIDKYYTKSNNELGEIVNDLATYIEEGED